MPLAPIFFFRYIDTDKCRFFDWIPIVDRYPPKMLSSDCINMKAGLRLRFVLGAFVVSFSIFLGAFIKLFPADRLEGLIRPIIILPLFQVESSEVIFRVRIAIIL